MKRFLCLLLSFVMVLSLCACGGNADSQSSAPQESENVQQADDVENSDAGSGGDVEVEKGLFDVTLTIPADFFDGGTTQDDLDQEAKDNGYQSATLNDDGSVTYVMTKAQHQEMMQGIKDTIDSSLSEIAASEDYPGIVKVEANSDYTQYKVYLSTEEVGLSESMAVLSFYIFGGMYHVFNGTESGNINVQYISDATGEVIQEANSNDMG